MQNSGEFRTRELLMLDQTVNVCQISDWPLPWSLASWLRARGRGWTQPEPSMSEGFWERTGTHSSNETGNRNLRVSAALFRLRLDTRAPGKLGGLCGCPLTLSCHTGLCPRSTPEKEASSSPVSVLSLCPLVLSRFSECP